MPSVRIALDNDTDTFTISCAPDELMTAGTNMNEATRRVLIRAVKDAHRWLDARTDDEDSL